MVFQARALLLIVLSAVAVATDGATDRPAMFHVDFRGSAASFDPRTGAFSVEDARSPDRVYIRGEIGLPRGRASVPKFPTYRWNGERGVVSFDDAGLKSEIVFDVSYDGVKITVPAGCAISGEVLAGAPDDGTAVFALVKDAVPDGLVAASGPAIPQGADAVFDRRTDTLYAIDGANLDYSYNRRRYSFTGNGEVKFACRGGYLANRYRIAYRPVNTNSVFRTPPVGWMTWYAAQFDTCDRVVMENARAFRERFGDYTDEHPVLWVDWEWFHEKMNSRGEEDHDMMSPRKAAYPRGMKAVADDLKALGFTPALWVSMACDVRTNRMWKTHPEWILGTHDNWSGANWADPTAPGFCEEFVPAMFNLYRSWGYEAFKWDCLYNALWMFAKFRDRAYDPSMTSEEVFRKMIAAGRDAVGPNAYLMGCAGLTDRVILGAIDILDSSRVGDDIFGWREFFDSGVNRILSYYPFHQTVFYADADNLVLRSEHSNEAQARTRVSVYGLSGVPISIGDRMSALDDVRVDMLRRVMPVVPTHPATLGRGVCRSTDLDLKVDVRRPFGSWQVRGWSNLSTNTVRHVMFAPEDVAVWDFWNDRLQTETEFDVAPCDTRVVRVTPLEKEGLTLLSVSRHITQGGYELERYASYRTGVTGAVRCPGGGETVKVTFLVPRGERIASASHPYDFDGRVMRLRIESAMRANVAFKVCLLPDVASVGNGAAGE